LQEEAEKVVRETAERLQEKHGRQEVLLKPSEAAFRVTVQLADGQDTEQRVKPNEPAVVLKLRMHDKPPPGATDHLAPVSTRGGVSDPF